MYLSVIVPVYNEEKTLEKNIKKFYSYLAKQNFDYEIIIVDDGSTDNSNQIAQTLSDQFPTVRLLSKKNNQGKGSAVRDGLFVGFGDFLLFLDADNATSINHLEKAWPLLKNNDIVIGSRHYLDVDGAKQIIPQNFIKRLLGISGNKLIKLVTGLNIYDTQCGFKLFSKENVNKIFSKTKINRWAIDVEILIIAKKQNLKIAIIPVAWHCGPTSRVGIRGYAIALGELLIIKLNELKGFYN
jgi:glycosyltransferase involved in cell wall biosynthesis